MNTPFLGMLAVYAFDFAPKDWSQCQGQLMPISRYQALFSLLGTTYGGDGVNTFKLPDLQGRRIVGSGDQYMAGQIGGNEKIVLKTEQLPAHTHTGTYAAAANGDTRADTNDPTGNYLGTLDGDGIQTYAAKTAATGFAGAPKVILGSTGTSQPVVTLSPGLALTCCIALNGIYPSRN